MAVPAVNIDKDYHRYPVRISGGKEGDTNRMTGSLVEIFFDTFVADVRENGSDAPLLTGEYIPDLITYMLTNAWGGRITRSISLDKYVPSSPIFAFADNGLLRELSRVKDRCMIIEREISTHMIKGN